MTHRQTRAWAEWLEAEWERPSRSDLYAMQIAREIHATPARAWGEQPPNTRLKDFRIEFKEPEVVDAPAGSVWAAYLGVADV